MEADEEIRNRVRQLDYFWICVECLEIVTRRAVDNSPVFERGEGLENSLAEYIASHDDELEKSRGTIEKQRNRLLSQRFEVPDEWLAFPIVLAWKIDPESMRLTEDLDVTSRWRRVAEDIRIKSRRLEHSPKTASTLTTNSKPAIEAGPPSAELPIDLAPELPTWDSESCRIIFRGEVVRSVAKRATNCICILTAFNECGWPYCIDDPLPGGKDADRLNQAVRTLNKGLHGIEFFAAGDGQSIGWKVLGDS
jgi:hypothetical protein